MEYILVGNFCVRNLFKEALVFILGYFTLITVPNCLKIVKCLTIKFNRVTNKLRKLLNNLFYLILSAEFSWIRLYILCLWIIILLWALNWFSFLSRSEGFQHQRLHILPITINHHKTYRSIWYPSNSFMTLCLWDNFNWICNNKTGVEPNTKLSNYTLSSTLVWFFYFLNKCLRAWSGNSSQIVNDLVSCHTNTSILN